jgi:hypothetical protein
MAGRVDKKKEGCDGEVGFDEGNAPIFTSFINK